MLVLIVLGLIMWGWVEQGTECGRFCAGH